MAAAGKQIDEVLACPGLAHGDAMELLLAAVGSDGSYKMVQVTSDRVQFARTFRPTWAIVAGCATVWIALLGVLFFFVTTTETCVGSVETDHTGTRIRLSGRLSAEALGRIHAALHAAAGGAAAMTPSTVGAPVANAHHVPSGFSPSAATSVQPVVPAPIASPPSPQVPVATPTATPQPMAPPMTPPPVPQSVPPATPPVPQAAPPMPPAAPVVPVVTPAAPAAGVPGLNIPRQPGVGSEAAPSSTSWYQGGESAAPAPAVPTHDDRTVTVAQIAASLPPTIKLDDGSVRAVGALLLIGRDPEGDNVLALEDQSRSVSKTHLSVEPTPHGWKVSDLHSTNGVAVIDSQGVEHRLAPGGMADAAPGDTVKFGERTLVLGNTGGAG